MFEALPKFSVKIKGGFLEELSVEIILVLQLLSLYFKSR